MGKPDANERASLYGLDPEDALRALLAVDPADPGPDGDDGDGGEVSGNDEAPAD